MQISTFLARSCLPVVVFALGCAPEPTSPLKLTPHRPNLDLTDGYEMLSISVGGPGRINAYPQPPRGTYWTSVSGGATADYYYVWSVRMCNNWDNCPSGDSGTWYEYSQGVNRSTETIYMSSDIVLVEVRVEVGEWTGDPNFVGRTGLSNIKMSLGPAGFGSGSGFDICGDRPSHYPFVKDTTNVYGDPAKIGYTYKKCGGGRLFDPAGPR